MNKMAKLCKKFRPLLMLSLTFSFFRYLPKLPHVKYHENDAQFEQTFLHKQIFFPTFVHV